MWQERADRTRREISALATDGLGVEQLHAAAIALVSETARADLTCWASLDPETLVISTMVSGEDRIPAHYEPALAEAEYTPEEPHRFATLASRGQRMAKLTDLPAASRAHSFRWNEVWRPLGQNQELRLMFLLDGACWGAAGMTRSGSDFTDREVEYLHAVAPALAAATRAAVRSQVMRSPALRDVAADQPAVAVLGPDGELRSATPAAREWQDRFDDVAPGRFLVLMRAMSAGARAAPGGFQGRVRDAQGRWVVLHASPLVGGPEDQTAVSIAPATGDQLMGLLFAAFGLTARERDVFHEVVAGRSTADIAGRLFISTNTVQDHLKSVFAKVGVRSRGELVARLRSAGVEAHTETSATTQP